ncbi:cilia- and flagella-associated protein 107-like [Acipenser ruthenus]|uniref:cilia- and flagella-associated protein 107-like n=1 Tax=Acipenser ruthenus TaxID=7906 RepID=UPI0027410922|nr:cilia- and flagella-associated protein 107-like [Acipenser ruthenus]
MAGAQSDPKKWSMPGWRIEEKYSNKVLIGNWVEERLQFTRKGQTGKTTNQLDYRPYSETTRDVVVRTSALKREEGLPSRVLLAHHDTPNSDHLVSLYDEVYCRQGRNPALPPLRSWKYDSLAWVPERSDHPLKGPATNFGLLQLRVPVWKRQHSPTEQESLYRASYTQHPSSAFSLRHCRLFSSHLHTPNSVNKDLHLRNQTCRLVPEYPNTARCASSPQLTA